MTFRFFNAMPGDWLEGANEGHLYELCFKRPPSAQQRATIAGRYERDLAQGPAETASRKHWSWSGAWARFYVGERWVSRYGGRAAFAQVAELVQAIDRVASLEHAAFLGAREAIRWPDGSVPGPAVDQRPVD